MKTADATLVHEALLYHTADELGRVVNHFVLDARAKAEPVLIALPAGNLEFVRDLLGAAAAAVRFEDMAELGGNPSCLLSAYRAWIDDHDGPVRVVGEAVWAGRTEVELVECLRHEALINHVLSDFRVSILCPYDAARLDGETLGGAELTHPQLVSGEGRRRESHYYGEPIEVYAGERWPQASATEPVSRHVFDGNLGALRQAIASDPIVSSLSRERLYDLVFAVNEAATNALAHADGTCTARLWHDGTSVVSEISTDSVIDDVAVGSRRPAPEATSGRGLWLINQVCDLVELRSGEAGTTLRLHVR